MNGSVSGSGLAEGPARIPEILAGYPAHPGDGSRIRSTRFGIGTSKRDLDEGTVFQIVFDEVSDDAADPEADPGELDEELHVGGLEDLVDLDLVFGQVGIDVLPAHVGAV